MVIDMKGSGRVRRNRGGGGIKRREGMCILVTLKMISDMGRGERLIGMETYMRVNG